jgi:hypothetical protein
MATPARRDDPRTPPEPTDLRAALGRDLGDLDPAHLALVLRAQRALCTAVRQMPGDLLAASLAAPTDFGALVRTLNAAPVPAATTDADPLAGALARAIEHRRILREAAGELLSSTQVAALLGVTRPAVDKRRREGRLLALRLGSDWAYPALQFRDGAPDPLMTRLLEAHAEDDAWVVLDLLLAPDSALGGRSLLDAIRQDDTAAVDRHIAQLSGDGFG